MGEITSSDPPPTLQSAEMSPPMREFVSGCLHKSPGQRLSAAQLLDLPWLFGGDGGRPPCILPAAPLPPPGCASFPAAPLSPIFSAASSTPRLSTVGSVESNLRSGRGGAVTEGAGLEEKSAADETGGDVGQRQPSSPSPAPEAIPTVPSATRASQKTARGFQLPAEAMISDEAVLDDPGLPSEAGARERLQAAAALPDVVSVGHGVAECVRTADSGGEHVASDDQQPSATPPSFSAPVVNRSYSSLYRGPRDGTFELPASAMVSDDMFLGSGKL